MSVPADVVAAESKAWVWVPPNSTKVETDEYLLVRMPEWFAIPLELLRFEPPGPHVARYVAEDVEYHDEVVPAGSALLLMVAAANRDERRFPDPDRFDVHRDSGQSLTFGHGAHYCLGAALARIEGRIALDEVLNRWPAWEIDLDAAVRAPTSTVRGWDSMPAVVR